MIKNVSKIMQCSDFQKYILNRKSGFFELEVLMLKLAFYPYRLFCHELFVIGQS